MDQGVVLATIIFYKALLIGVGVWASRRTSSEGDFFIGDRALGPWVAGLSYAASTSSAWVLLGFSGFVYSVGLSALWMVPGVWMGYVIAWLWIGPRIRSAAERKSHITLTDYLVEDLSGPWRTVSVVCASALILFCFTFYIGAQFQAAGAAFADTFGMNATEAILLGAAVILVYALMGGFWAVSLTDTIQGAVMGLVAILLPALAVIAAGGPIGLVEALRSSAPEGYFDWTGGHDGLPFLFFILGLAAIGLGTCGQPQLMNRLMAVRDDKARRQGFAIAMGWGVAVFMGMTALALAGRSLAPTLSNGETIFYEMTETLLPPVLAGIVLAAILSAVMSTVDSVLLASAGAVAHDLGVAKGSEARALLASRITMAAICVVSIGLTLSVEASIFGRVLFAWTALGAAFGPIVIARVIGLAPPAWAVAASMLVGFALAVGFNQFWPPGPGAINERLLPWMPSLLVLIAASKFKFRRKAISHEI